MTRLLAVAVALSLSAGVAQAQGAPKGGDGTFLPFLNAVEDGRPRTESPRLQIRFGLRRITAIMDTGSTGLVVSASAIPHWEQLRSLGPAQLTYSSSGRVMRGRWVITPLAVAGRDGTVVQTEPIPVMAVTRISCLAKARDCAPEKSPRHVAMLGIGYARQADHQPQSTPDRNPFLRTEAEKLGQLRRGYIVTRDGVSVGLSSAAIDPAFVTIPLERDQRTGDWSAPPLCISIDDRQPLACGTVLVDTGVTGSYLSAGGGQLTDVGTNSALRPGTKVSVELRGQHDPRLGYTFQVGEYADPLTPDKVTVVRTTGPAFLNTSVHFLNGFDILYNADQGLAGYRVRR